MQWAKDEARPPFAATIPLAKWPVMRAAAMCAMSQTNLISMRTSGGPPVWRFRARRAALAWAAGLAPAGGFQAREPAGNHVFPVVWVTIYRVKQLSGGGGPAGRNGPRDTPSTGSQKIPQFPVF